MQKTLAVMAGAVVIGSSAFSAQAADLATISNYQSVVPQTYAPADPFTGFYVGGTAGVVSADDLDWDTLRGTVGGQIGYLQQFGAFSTLR